MKNYHGDWIDLFNIRIDPPNYKYHYILETPDMDYGMTKEQFREFKKKVNMVEL